MFCSGERKKEIGWEGCKWRRETPATHRGSLYVCLQPRHATFITIVLSFAVDVLRGPLCCGKYRELLIPPKYARKQENQVIQYTSAFYKRKICKAHHTLEESVVLNIRHNRWIPKPSKLDHMAVNFAHQHNHPLYFSAS